MIGAKYKTGWALALAAAMLGGALSAEANIFQAMKTLRNNQPPKIPFAKMTPPPAPDYSRLDSWASHPALRDGGDRTPAGVDAIDQTRAPVDVFFVYPTVFFSRTAWNADIGDATYRTSVDTLPLSSQASVFNGCCAIYAPHYRQMTLGGYVKWSANSEAATDLAYGDVARAFDMFLEKHNRGRPFIIAGHSQGSRLARRLIAERVAGTTLESRFVGGYLIGHWIEASWFDGLGGIRPCTSAAQTRCIVTYSSYAEGRDATQQRKTLARTSRYKPELSRTPYVCTNPLDLAAGERTVAASGNAGGWMPGEGKAAETQLEPRLVSARSMFRRQPNPIRTSSSRSAIITMSM